MRLSAETQHLLNKRLKQALSPIEIALCALASLLVFSVVFCCNCFQVRYSDKGLAHVGIAVCALLTLASAALAAIKYKHSRPSRAWIALSVCLAASFAAGFILGDRYWYRYMISYYNWQEMASYVNVDPAVDKGQSYMDAGVVYFAEGSHPVRDRGVAFRNGHTYCVAPILKQPIEYTEGVGMLPTDSGYVLPRSGTVDFWAVGQDCCGSDGSQFNCGDADSVHARSGLRLVDEASRSMYLLAVQEWSATTGLPVRHPIFFTWVKDPVLYTEGIYSRSFGDFWAHFAVVFVASVIASFVMHVGLQKLHVH